MTTSQTATQKLQALIDLKVSKFNKLTEQAAAIKAAIDADVAKLSTIEVTEKFESAIAAGLPSGTVVHFFFGREASRKQYIGTVVGFKASEGKVPATYAVSVGEGFDTEVKRVPAAAIIGIGGQPQETPVPYDIEALVAVTVDPADIESAGRDDSAAADPLADFIEPAVDAA